MICAGIEGSVTVLCWVNLDGVPEDVAAFDATLPEFADAAVEAMKWWSFVPATRDGRPLAMRIAVPFQFRPIFPTTHALAATLKNAAARSRTKKQTWPCRPR